MKERHGITTFTATLIATNLLLGNSQDVVAATSPPHTGVKNVVLVHGAFADGSGWEAAPAAPPVNTRFALLGPFGEAVSETRPEFIWQPLAGAAHYSVVIVDEGLHPVQRSHALRTTVWRPRRPLRRGHTYLWQVTATLRGGTKVVASAPSEARLRIAPATAKLADNEAQ
jgi:hypothetical protein